MGSSFEDLLLGTLFKAIEIDCGFVDKVKVDFGANGSEWPK